MAVLGVSDVVWPSDETGPRDRLAIQHGFLSAYGPPVLLVYGRASRPTEVAIRPRTIDLRRRYRIAATQTELNGVEAAAGLHVPFILAPDADVLVLDAIG